MSSSTRTDSGRSGGTPPGGKPSGGHPSGGEPSGGKPSGGKPSGGKPALPAIGTRGMLRYLWRQLTSMQTALILLLLLALAAVPGSILPQRNVNPGAVTEYIAGAGVRGQILDALGFFNVFSSPWFSAIYLLLFVSLVGCILPRSRTLLSQLRSRPPRTPRRLNRFTGYAAFTAARDEHVAPGAAGAADEGGSAGEHVAADTAGEGGSAGTAGEGAALDDAQRQAERARDELKRQRYRVDLLEEKGGAWSVTSERGYVREAGNLLFHIGMLGLLVTLALGNVFQWRGQVTLVEGEGFTNSLARYDSFQSGPLVRTSMLPDFNLVLEDFEATYETTPGGQFGQARSFDATVTTTLPSQEPQTSLVQVNQPVTVPGANVYLLGNGYAPSLTVTDPQGDVVASGPKIALPTDAGNMTSNLVVKAPDAEPEQMAVLGVLMPTQSEDTDEPVSVFPDTLDPALQLTAYTGDLGLDEGVPRNVYEVDVSTLEQVTDESGEPFQVRLEPGESAELPGGGSVRFDGLDRFAAFDVEHNPFGVPSLVTALISTAGLAVSLFVPRRRLWARFTPEPAAEGVRVEVAGLARSHDQSLADVVADWGTFLGAPARDLAPGDDPRMDTDDESRDSSSTAAPRTADPRTDRRTTE